MRRTIFLLLTYMLISGGAAATGASENGIPILGRGMNIDFDLITREPHRLRFKSSYYKMLRESGFQHIRLNLRAFKNMDASDRLNENWLKNLDSVLNEAAEAGLLIILDEHDFESCRADAGLCRQKLLAFWSQVALRYRGAPSEVLFELLNEPSRAITPDLWNAILAELLVEIRRSNPSRVIVIGPAGNNKLQYLEKLVLPKLDRNIIVTVHYYDPYTFTHQGAWWTSPSLERRIGVKWRPDSGQDKITRDFELIANWAKQEQRPILIGEFGAYDKGDLISRASWISSVARTAESFEFAWTYWQFGHDFKAFDMEHETWIEPIYRALIPK